MKCRIILELLAILFFTGCYNREQISRLDEAEALIQNKPDSALTILQQLKSEGSQAEQAKYALLYSEALDKNHIKATNDSLIRRAWEYYKHHPKDLRRQCKTLYYWGKVKLRTGDKPGALRLYLKVEEKLKDTNEPYYAGLLYSQIGEVYYDQMNYSRAYHYFREARNNFRQADNTREETKATLDMAAATFNSKDMEKAMRLYSAALDLADEHKYDKLAKATTSKDKQVAEAALAALEKKRAEYSKLTGNEQYDQLLQQYKTYQQQQTEIMKTYAAQRVEAEKQGNIAMIAQINAKEQAELSKLAASRLMASESWNQLFSDLSTLTTNTINKLITDINSKKVSLSAQFNPADLKAINDQLEKAKDELHERNPFLALKDSLAELRAAMKADKLLESDDPFVKSLEERKKQYQAYTDTINSGDEILAGAAKEAFAELLSEGSSYVDYLRRKIAELNKQKATIKLTVEGEEQLAVLNAALSKEEGTTKSVSAAFKESFKSIGSSIDLVSGAFDSVVSGIKKMGVSMDEETDAILGDIGGMLEGAGQFAAGYASMNPVQMVSGAVGFLSSAFDLFNTRDRKAEKSIKKHQEAVTKLGYAYNALEHAVDSALGETVYQNQNAMIQNLRAQQNEIQGMINDEISKKKTDWGRVDEFREQYAEAGRQIEDLIKEITESITQTSATELADELANALVEAFEGGENAAKAFGEVANDVIKNAVVNALKLQFLEQPLQKAIKQLQKDMGFDEEGNGSFNGLTETEQARFKQAIQAAGANFAAAMDMYKDLFEQLDEDDPSTLSGAIKGASQESIDLLAGQTNAVRVNQVTSLQLLRQQLTHLANMDTTLGVISRRLLTIINKITNTPTDDLRSQGITD